jgi:translation initiation factor IF-1
MAKEDTIVMQGKVQEILPNTMFRVKLDDTNTEVIGYLSGRMRTHKIKVLAGDTVEIEFTLYDLTRGRITRRK